jgi:hypothetical protein
MVSWIPFQVFSLFVICSQASASASTDKYSFFIEILSKYIGEEVLCVSVKKNFMSIRSLSSL